MSAAVHATDRPEVSPGGTPSPVSLIRLAVAGGRSDRVRIALTAVGSTIAAILLLIAASVAFIADGDGPYRLNVIDEPGLRPGVIVALVALTVPVVVFVGLCTRVGAPARDRRLSVLRLAGATASDTTRIAAIETGLAASVGAAAGVLVFFAVRGLFGGQGLGSYSIVSEDGMVSTLVEGPTYLLPVDVGIPVWAVAVVVAAIGLGAAAAAVVALRKVRITPLAVTRVVPTTPPAHAAVALFLTGAGGLVAVGTWKSAFGDRFGVLVLAAFALFVCCVVGLLLGSASLAAAVGRALAPRTSRPSLLIAARRMIAAPYTSSRGIAAVLLVALIGGAIQGTRANFLAGADPTDTFYADTFALLDGTLAVAAALAILSLLVTSAEAIVERRRTLAVLVAAGTPRSVLARAAVAEVIVPLVPSVFVASIAGMLASRAFFGTAANGFDTTGAQAMVAVPVPWERLLVLDLGIVAAALAITALSLIFLGRSTRPEELRAAA